jgi:hypothetical protein
MNDPYQELRRGSKKWLEYASLLVDCTTDDLRETQARFILNRKEQHGRGDGYAVAYTDMQLGCISNELASRDSGVRRRRD